MKNSYEPSRGPYCRVRIVDVARTHRYDEGLRGFNIDFPIAGTVFEDAPIRIEGWALPKDDSAVQILAFNQCGVLLQQVPCSRSSYDVWANLDKVNMRDARARFFLQVTPIDLYENDYITISASVGKESYRLCEISTVTKVVEFEARDLRKIDGFYVRTIGRTASTALMQMLDCSDDIVMHPDHAFEFFFSQYTAGAFRLETLSLDDANWGTEYNMFSHPTALGPNPFLGGRFGNMDQTIFRLAFEDRDRYFSRIERVYLVLAKMQNRRRARLFCEKLFEANVVRALDVMMGARKKIFLVRHPCAAYLSRKRFAIAMQKDDGGVHGDNLFYMQAEMMAREYVAHNNHCLETLLLKQEEMLEDINAVAYRVENFLGVAIDRGRLAQSMTRSSASPILSKSISESSAEWRHELHAEEIAQVKQRASLFAATFDYRF